MKLLIASRNDNKIKEIETIFSVPSLELVGTSAFNDLPEVIEDCVSFQGNAVKKAMTMALAAGMWALSDDSGLEVDALGGAPGVRSARYAGERCDYADNNAKLIYEMRSESERTARFICVVALSCPSGRVQTVEGTCRGRISHEPRGDAGFGYDPVFIPDGYSKTFAELDPLIKNRISHRGKALEFARGLWGDMLTGSPSGWPMR